MRIRIPLIIHASIIVPLALAISPKLIWAGPSSQVFWENESAELPATKWQTPDDSFNARSAALADIDNDGDLDIIIQHQSGTAIYVNQLGDIPVTPLILDQTVLRFGGNQFESRWSSAWADIDGDNDIDFFSGQVNAGRTGDYLRNDGTGIFSDASSDVGLTDPGFHQNVGWADMNSDQRLDLVIGMEGPEEHEVYLQGATGMFTAVGASIGFQVPFGTKAYGTAIGDTDGDGDLEIYISTCRGGGNIRNNFFVNSHAQTGTLALTDIADSNGTQYMDNSYHAEFADFDDDGDLDLFMVGADGNDSKIWRNDGNNQFTDTDTLRGGPLLTDNGRDQNGGRAIDYDNDGDLDLWVHDHLPDNSGTPWAGRLFRNDGDWVFTDVTFDSGVGQANVGAYDSTWGDLDLDGDLDLVIPASDGSRTLYVRNFSAQIQNPNNWLYVRLAGETWNTRGVGATLYATINKGTPQERTLRREANTNAGTFNQSDLPVHFGLGAAAQVDELRIDWPDGSTQIETATAPNQHITINFRRFPDSTNIKVY